MMLMMLPLDISRHYGADKARYYVISMLSAITAIATLPPPLIFDFLYAMPASAAAASYTSHILYYAMMPSLLRLISPAYASTGDVMPLRYALRASFHYAMLLAAAAFAMLPPLRRFSP